MSMKSFALPSLALFCTAALFAANSPVFGAPSPLSEGAQESNWDKPPQEFHEMQRRGFHDGIKDAHKDLDNRRAPDVNNRDEHRNASFPPEIREQYREATPTAVTNAAIQGFPTNSGKRIRKASVGATSEQ